MKNVNYKNLIFMVVTIMLSSSILFGYNGSGYILSGGINRSFKFHAPGSSVGINLPLMIVFHGDNARGAIIEGYSGFDAVADANNFIVVYPDALYGTWNRYADNVAGDAGLDNIDAPDDILFTSDMIDYFCNTYSINTKKVYAAGHSAGGYMCYNLAVQLPNKIAAFAPVSASLWGDKTFLTNYFSKSYTPVPIYHIHGDSDPEVDYPDIDNVPGSWSEWPLSSFSYPNCTTDTYSTSTDIVSGVKKISFCSSGKEVYLIRILGGGHSWPNISGFIAPKAIWDFCNQYSLIKVSSCTSGIFEKNDITEISVAPNPCERKFSLNIDEEPIKVELLDLLGNEIFLSKLDSKSFEFDYVSSGVFFIRISLMNGQKMMSKLIVK